MSYEEVNNKVYASNPYWTAIYDLLTGTVGPWGIPLPNPPDMALVDGDLPPGAYILGYTNVVGDSPGGQWAPPASIVGRG